MDQGLIAAQASLTTIPGTLRKTLSTTDRAPRWLWNGAPEVSRESRHEQQAGPVRSERLHVFGRVRRSRLRRSHRDLREYADVAMVNYSDSSGLWRIYARPDESRMKIGPSLARSLGGAFGPEVTFVPPTMGETRQTAQSWLASRGRPCMVTNGRLLVSPQWEFTYACG